jgi:hypothetical protein
MTDNRIQIGVVFSHSLAPYLNIVRAIKTFAMEWPKWMLVPIAPDVHAIRLAGTYRRRIPVNSIVERRRDFWRSTVMSSRRVFR